MSGRVDRARERVRKIGRVGCRVVGFVVILVGHERVVGATCEEERAADRGEKECDFHEHRNLTFGRFRQALGEIVSLLNFGFAWPGVGARVFLRVGASPEKREKNRCQHRFHRRKVTCLAASRQRRKQARAELMSGQRNRLLQIALPACEPGPVRVHVVQRAAIEAAVNRLPPSAGRFGIGILPAAPALLVLVHVFAHPRALTSRNASFASAATLFG